MGIDVLIRNEVERIVNQKKEELRNELLQELEVLRGQKQWYSRREAADYLRCCVASIDNMVVDGRLEKFKVGKSTKFKKMDLDKLPV